MTNKQILTQARQLVKNGWTQHVVARTVEGEPVLATSPDACYYCASGAVIAVAPPGEIVDSVLHVLNKVLAGNGYQQSDIISFNDAPTTTPEKMLGVFDKAIAAVSEDSWVQEIVDGYMAVFDNFEKK